MIAGLPILLAAASAGVIPPTPGVSEILANDRAAAIQSVRYDISFRIPQRKTEAVQGTEAIRLKLAAPRAVVLDFEQPRHHVFDVRVAGRHVDAEFVQGHIIVPASSTKAGDNVIDINFVAGDEALNRNDDFLYTLFVPARARLAFPCFDQPDLKARYSLEIIAPSNW